MIDFLNVIKERTADMAEVLAATDPTTPVPSCPGWTASDLGKHLYEVQCYWAAVAEGSKVGAEWEPPTFDVERLPAALVAASLRLCAAIAAADPESPLETWAGPQPPSWLARRQAHEVLIHGIDAVLAAGGEPHLPRELGRDGIEEVLEWHHGPPPSWAEWQPTEAIALVESDGQGRWRMEFGRLRGTSTVTGTDYDLEMVAAAPDGDTTATVSAPAGMLDLWLWRRVGTDALEVSGDRVLVDRVYAELAID